MDAMTEFTKMKISFALALLGTLFALHPFLDRFDDQGFLYLGYNLKVFYAYSLTAALLSLCVYLYGLTLMTVRPHPWCERVGNYAYGLALLVGPIYGGLFVSAKLAEEVALSHLAWAAPAVALGLGLCWMLFGQLAALLIRGRLAERDRAAKIAQLGRQEIESLDRSLELFEAEHYDLSVIEAWRALEARLRQALLSRRISAGMESADGVIHTAARKGVLDGSILEAVAEVRRFWTIAVSTEPLPRDDAVKALSAVRHILSVVPAQPVALGRAPTFLDHAAPVAEPRRIPSGASL
jgi:hypothetical protein